jgi:mannosyltransferase OCH1-like enzyme
MIEKNIFQSWFTRDVHPVIQEHIDKMKLMNPEYTHHLYIDEEMDSFVNEYFPGEIAESYNKLNIIVAKVDFWRYLILYKYGGVYLDFDSSIDKPLRELIKDNDDAIITAEGNPNMYVQWALIFKKEHPILKKTIDLIIDNIKYNRFPNDIHAMTGPAVYSRAIKLVNLKYSKKTLKHSNITPSTNELYRTDGASYRIYGIDYSGFFTFKCKFNDLLYANKTHWRVEQKEKNLLK